MKMRLLFVYLRVVFTFLLHQKDVILERDIFYTEIYTSTDIDVLPWIFFAEVYFSTISCRISNLLRILGREFVYVSCIPKRGYNC